jgi:hypothetical protein
VGPEGYEMRQDGKSDKSLKRYYEIINKKFYFGELPSNVIVRWAEPGEEPDIASTDWAKNKRHSYVILLNREKVPTRSIKLSSLLHETIHVVTQKNDDHGEVFSEWHQKLMDRGAFKKGALIRGITLF